MAIRLLPFRDYSEHNVVNLFRSAGNKGEFIDLSDSSKQSTAQGDAGVFVKVSNGALNPGGNDWDPVDVTTNSASLLGKTNYPHVGRNVYPQATLSVTGVENHQDQCLGITLRQTVEKDENGENLLYNPIKKDELFGVLPGEAVPVLSRGLVTVTDAAVHGTPDVGSVLVPGPNGKVSGIAPSTVGAAYNTIGTVIASGVRNDYEGSQGGENVFGNAGLMSGNYYILKIDCA
jgi:hypothetical protein